MISAKILADSINPLDCRLTSFLLTYPRFIHSEFMTHRVFSRNAASSRAIPFKKMFDTVFEEPALPERWGVEQKGMQSGDQIYEVPVIESMWMKARNQCLKAADYLSGRGLHKSLCNRLIEPWSHITVLATATDTGLSNFFALRAHKDAQPEFQVLAYRMLNGYLKEKPNKLPWGYWHFPQFMGSEYEPFYDGKDQQAPDEVGGKIYNFSDVIKIATARCARLSYLTFDGEHSPEKDIALHDQLKASGHFSPFEHCAQAKIGLYKKSNFDQPEDGVFSGWHQYRKMIKGENQTNADLHAIMAAKPDWIRV